MLFLEALMAPSSSAQLFSVLLSDVEEVAKIGRRRLRCLQLGASTYWTASRREQKQKEQERLGVPHLTFLVKMHACGFVLVWSHFSQF